MFRNMIPFDIELRKKMPFGLQTLRNWLLERLMIKSMASADLVIFISNYARSIIENRTKLVSAITIPHGISQAFRKQKNELPRPTFLPKGEYILYVSRFDAYKHHDQVIKAYSKLDNEKKINLVLIGEKSGVEFERAEKLVNELHLQSRVYIVGAVPYKSLPAVYHHAHLTLFASSCENCPNILLEALGAGRPVLSSNVMPMPEFGEDAVGYFSPFDSENIFKAISKCLEDKNYAKELAEKALLQSKKFDWENTSRLTWDSITNLYLIHTS